VTHKAHCERMFTLCQQGDLIELRLFPEGAELGIMLGSKLRTAACWFKILRRDGTTTEISLFRQRDDVAVISRFNSCVTIE